MNKTYAFEVSQTAIDLFATGQDYRDEGDYIAALFFFRRSLPLFQIAAALPDKGFPEFKKFLGTVASMAQAVINFYEDNLVLTDYDLPETPLPEGELQLVNKANEIIDTYIKTQRS